MTKFKKGDYVQDLKGNVYEVQEVDSHTCEMPYLLKAVKRAVAEITKTTPSAYEGYFGFAHVGDKQWVYKDAAVERNERRYGEDFSDVLTTGDLALFDPQAVKPFKEIRYFKGDVWEDQDGNQFKVLENCTYGDASCKVKLIKRVTDRIIVGSCFYEDNFEFAWCVVDRHVYEVLIHEDEVFMCEMMPVRINNNARTIQNTKPEDQREAKSKLLELVKQMQTTAEPDASFKDRMKQIATKAKVQHALEAIEQAANRGEFSIFIPNGIFIREELEAYGLTVNGDVVTWA
jgi:hypothetical protein|nr:MAG TPA: hypothetical protein [Caudoviricetes sp.]DAQ38589.1 MAG TPA: hypothetical protein [Caudoviricetes sp.]